MASVVVDASSVLALLQGEDGAETVEAAINGAVMSAANLAEVVGKLADAGMPEAAIRTALAGLPMLVAPLDEAQAYTAGLLRPPTKKAGLSLGDRACLALAKALDATALTADRSWRQAPPGVRVRAIR